MIHYLSEELKRARGYRFGELYKQIYLEVSPSLVEQAKLREAKNGKFNLVDAGVLAIQFNLQLKHVFDFLEGQKYLPSGTYQRLKNRGLKVYEVMAEAKKELGQ